MPTCLYHVTILPEAFKVSHKSILFLTNVVSCVRERRDFSTGFGCIRTSNLASSNEMGKQLITNG